MTKEEAIAILEREKGVCEKMLSRMERVGIKPNRSALDALDVALSALRPITREQVEKMRGEWKSYLNGDYNDEVYYCGVCGCELDSTDKTQNFCCACGSPMTDEAVDILWHRLEAMQDADD